MSVYGGKELAAAFRTVRKNTIQVAEDIPESKYAHVPAAECKSVGGMLAHIAVSTQIWEEIHKKQRRTTLVGLDYFGIRGRIDADEAKPRTKAPAKRATTRAKAQSDDGADAAAAQPEGSPAESSGDAPDARVDQIKPPRRTRSRTRASQDAEEAA